MEMDENVDNNTVDRDEPLGEKAMAKTKAKAKKSRGRPRVDASTSTQEDALKTEKHRVYMREKYRQQREEKKKMIEEIESDDDDKPSTTTTSSSSKDEELKSVSRKYARRRNRDKEIGGIPQNFLIAGGLFVSAFIVWQKFV